MTNQILFLRKASETFEKRGLCRRNTKEVTLTDLLLVSKMNLSEMREGRTRDLDQRQAVLNRQVLLQEG